MEYVLHWGRGPRTAHFPFSLPKTQKLHSAGFRFSSFYCVHSPHLVAALSVYITVWVGDRGAHVYGFVYFAKGFIALFSQNERDSQFNSS